MAVALFRDVITHLEQGGSGGFSSFDELTISPILQFGTEEAPYLLQTLLPEMLKNKNQYSEGAIEYISALAAAGSSYAPTEINKGGNRIGVFDVKFGFTNQKDVLDVATYELIHDILMMSDDSANMSNVETAGESVLDWVENNITKPQMDLNELYRSQAIIDYNVQRVGANGYSETVTYPNAPGQRLDIGGGTEANPQGWYSTEGDYDPMLDLIGIQDAALKKGLEIVRIISDYTAKSAFMRAPRIRGYIYGINISLSSGATIEGFPEVVDEDSIDALLRRYRLPRWETYDKTYNLRDEDTQLMKPTRFLERELGDGSMFDSVIFVCRTRRRVLVHLPDPFGDVNLNNLLGYYGVGRNVGHQNPGRILNRFLEDKLHPPSFTAEIIQEGLPVLQAPEAFFVLNIYRPTKT